MSRYDDSMMVTITIGGIEYTDRADGWYSKAVPPGSAADNTSGQVGQHMVYVQHAEGADAAEFRPLVPLFSARRAELQAAWDTESAARYEHNRPAIEARQKFAASFDYEE